MRGLGPDAVYHGLTVSFPFLLYSVVLLSPYLCFISFLYLDLYLLGDDSWIIYGSVMRTKHLCVLIHIRTKGEVGTV